MASLFAYADNPFNPGSGAAPPFLAGRNEEIATFAASLKYMTDGRGENFVLTGLRGTGKTVLLNEFDKICSEKKIFPIKRLQFTAAYNTSDMFADALKYDISAA